MGKMKGRKKRRNEGKKRDGKGRKAMKEVRTRR